MAMPYMLTVRELIVSVPVIQLSAKVAIKKDIPQYTPPAHFIIIVSGLNYLHALDSKYI
jgi:hypothetical protein